MLTLTSKIAAATLISAVGISAVPFHDGRDSDVSVRVAPKSGGDATAEAVDARGFWTEDKLKHAVPLDDIIDRPASDVSADAGRQLLNRAGPSPADVSNGTFSSAPVNPENPQPRRLAQAGGAPSPTNAVGRLFIRMPGGGSTWCTASTVNTPTQNLIITAAHCVHPGQPGQAYYNDFLFAPGYDKGPSKHGYWAYEAVASPTRWTNAKDYSYDQAVLRLQEKDGKKIVQAVGANGFSLGEGFVQSGVRIWGYPGAPLSTGEVPLGCDGMTTSRSGSSTDAKTDSACNVHGGSSGGPWLKNVAASGLGYIWAIHSRSQRDAGIAYSTPLPLTTRALWEELANE